MDNEQAKLILSTYRPGGEDASDPFFAEALEQARLDPELNSWFAEQRRFDKSVQSALQATIPPAGLREKLLVNRSVVRFHSPARGWRRFLAANLPLLSVAAAILLLLAYGVFFPQKPARPLSTQTLVEMAIDLEESDGITHGKSGGGNDALRSWLAAQGAPSDFVLPAGLKQIDGVGCQSFDIGGHKVSLICFIVDEERDLVVHFFVADSEGLEQPPGSEPIFTRRDGLTAVAWSSGKSTYILLGRNMDEEALRQLI